MFLKFFKIFIAIILVFVFIFLVSLSFFSNKKVNDNTKNIISNIENGDYSLIENKSSIVEAFSGSKIGAKAFLKKLNSFDSVYSSNLKNFSVSDNKNNIDIKISSGSFIFDLNNLDKNYKIISDNFEADLVGVGKIYIDINTDKILIFSLSSTMKLDFKEKTFTKSITSLYLFPHDYIKFDPIKNIDLLNADLFRIKSKISNGYFGFNIKNKEELYKLIKNDFFDISISFLEAQIFNDKTNYNNLYLDIAIDYPLKDYIEKYFVLFINPVKKESYYKNMILNDVLLLFKSAKQENQIIQNIKDNLKKLKDISEAGYNDVLFSIDIYYETLIKNNDFDNYYTITNFRDLKNQEQINNFIYLKDIIYLQDIYINYDFFDNNNIKQKITTFLNYFFSGKIKDNNVIFTNQTDILFMESFVFYLENQIKSILFEDGVKDIKDDLSILNNYLSLTNTIYFGDKNYDIIKTGLIKNIELLSIINDFIIKNIFEPREDKTQLLKNNTSFDLSKEYIQSLKASIDLMLSFFTTNKEKLDSQKDKIIAKIYSDYNLTFYEYFSALLDYEDYIQRFNSEQKGLLGFNKEQSNTVYTKTDIISYLSNFNFADLTNINISSINNDGFRVENYIISGSKLSFDIYPKDLNRIENITINDSSKASSYVLDEQKYIMDERLKGESAENSYLYNFKNFFSFLISGNTQTQSDQFVAEQEAPEETKTVIVFKRDILLGNDGEFSDLKGFLDIEYNDIQVKSKSDISIKNASLNISLKGRRDGDYVSNFESNYIITDSRHYFKDIKLVINDMFLGNKINLIGEINLSLFKTKMNSFFSKIDILDSVFSNLGGRILSIDYDLNSSKTIFKFEKSGKIIKITLLGDKIISITDNSKEYISKAIYYLEVNDILAQIK